ncbi:MAG: helix-turn-helix transcriptional regulator [Rickettsiales bacterium]|nr:helix-turn-helix transcriptional regulator [Rickettsiales bacterium]MDR1260896.1 helix-turn-helix transcriptional regulator [Rickettsiales bacterium]
MTASDDSNDDATDSLDYKVGQKIKSCRLAKGYTQKDLAKKIGVKYWVILHYEKGKRKISIKRLYSIAEALSISIIDLIPEHITSNEKSYLESEGEEILGLVEKCEKVENPEFRNVIYSLIKSTRVGKETSRKVARIEMAKNLVKVGVSDYIIFQATSLSIEEYSNAEEKTSSVDYSLGPRIKKLRLMRRYTQKDLAQKIGTTPKAIHDYEQGHIAVPLENLYKIAEALSVNIAVLLLGQVEEVVAKDELNSLIKECKGIDDQELRDEFYAMIKSISEGMLVIEEKVKKAEKIEIANKLLGLGISTDIVSKTTGLNGNFFD